MGVLTIAAIDETINETLGSRVADGVAEIRLRREDTVGRIDDGSCVREAKDVKAGPTTMLPPVGTLIVTLGEAADKNAEISREMLGSRVADGLAAEITLSSEERVGRNELGSCEA